MISFQFSRKFEILKFTKQLNKEAAAAHPSPLFSETFKF